MGDVNLANLDVLILGETHAGLSTTGPLVKVEEATATKFLTKNWDPIERVKNWDVIERVAEKRGVIICVEGALSLPISVERESDTAYQLLGIPDDLKKRISELTRKGQMHVVGLEHPVTRMVEVLEHEDHDPEPALLQQVQTTDVGNHIVDLLQHSRDQGITDHTPLAFRNIKADKKLSDLKNIMPSLQELMKIASHHENWKGMRETAQTAIKACGEWTYVRLQGNMFLASMAHARYQEYQSSGHPQPLLIVIVGANHCGDWPALNITSVGTFLSQKHLKVETLIIQDQGRVADETGTLPCPETLKSVNKNVKNIKSGNQVHLVAMKPCDPRRAAQFGTFNLIYKDGASVVQEDMKEVESKQEAPFQ